MRTAIRRRLLWKRELLQRELRHPYWGQQDVRLTASWDGPISHSSEGVPSGTPSRSQHWSEAPYR